MLAVGCLVNQTVADHADFRSSATFLDYDVVVWDPASTIREYRKPYVATYRGLPSIDDDDSVRLAADVKRRRDEIVQMLKLGRTIILFGAGPQVCYVDTGQRRTSGTGRNAQVTRIVDSLDLLSALPFKMTTVEATGRQLELRSGEPFASYWREVGELIEYRAYFDIPGATNVMVIEKTDRTVGAVMRVERGLVLVLPAPLWDSSATDEDAEEVEPDLLAAIRSLVDSLREETGNFKLPDWSSKYLLPDESAQRAELASREVERDALLRRIDDQKQQLAILGQRKILFTGSGAALETQAKAAFRRLGFEILDAPTGRDDFIARRKGKVAVVEVKGVTKSAAEKHAAQLEKWVAGYYDTHGEQPKGVLVANTFNEKRLGERTGADFPDQMLPYSKARGHVLVTGLQLLGAWLELDLRPDLSDEIAASLLSTVGVWDRYTDWKKFLTEEGTYRPPPEKRSAEVQTTAAPDVNDLAEIDTGDLPPQQAERLAKVLRDQEPRA
jgi:hypothetical protein